MNISLNTRYFNKEYKFNFIFGLLIAKRARNKTKNNITLSKLPPKVHVPLNIIENPFLLNKTPDKNNITVSPIIKLYAKLLIWFHKHLYFGLYLCSKLRTGVFNNTADATEIFYHLNPKNQNILCLPRAIFAMTTSKSFKKRGVLFIGVFFPSRHMHAWIIEDGYNVFRYDNVWINYKPIGIII